MNFKSELEAMLNDDFIDHELYLRLNSHSIGNRVKSLTFDLKYLIEQQKNVTNRVLDIMTELTCYKSALNTDISYSTSNGEDGSKYISARAALTIKLTNEKKSKRVISNFYLGDINKFIRQDGKIDIKLVKELGGAAVIQKLVTKVLEYYGL